MLITLSVSVITLISMVISIILKPYVKIGKIKVGLYCLISILGAIVLLILKTIPIKEVLKGITQNTAVNPLKILALFISMALISVYLGDAGFFSFIADWIFKKTKGGGIKLFLILYFVVAILTVFTSNDIIILTFTPPICIFCKKAKISPIPYLIGEFVGANTWSMALIVGNPTNIYLAGSVGITFFSYLKVMVLPAILGGLTSLMVLLILFYKPLTKKTEVSVSEGECVLTDKTPMIVALIHLLLCIIALSVSDIIHVEMWIICVVICGSLTLFNIVYRLITDKSVSKVFSSVKKAPFELAPFVLSMFVIVLALEKCELTQILSGKLISNTKLDSIKIGYISALSANFLNNIPMSVLFDKIISGKSYYAVYGAIIGSNIGAFITPVGALAGIMWSKILSSYNVKLPLYKFIFYGIIIALFTLTVSCATLILTV